MSKPERFGSYRLLDRIGDGGMAEIFLAEQEGYEGFRRKVALKRILPRYSSHRSFAKMLIHEAKLAALLQHYNVVQVHDLGEIDGRVFIAMEYIWGKDLAAVLSNTYRRKEKLPLNLAMCVATEFMTGLDYAHRMMTEDGSPLGIIHRDISPQNILISFEGEVKVTDFGIARILSEKEDALPGQLHGKFGYMSPEQVRGHEIDQRSDIFSAGVVLWEMLTGTRLFRGKDPKESIRMIATQPIKNPSEVNPEVPPSVDRIVLKALSRDRNERYQTTGALLGELSRVADSLPRRAATRDLSAYMRRQFGPMVRGSTMSSGTGGKERPRSEQSFSGFHTNTVSHAGQAPLANTDRVMLGQILMEQGSLTAPDLEIALADQRAQGGRIGEVLLSSGTISEDDLVRALATQADVKAISEQDLLALPPPTSLLKRFPKEAAEASLVLPISVNEEDRSVTLAVIDPYDEPAMMETKIVLGVNTVNVFLTRRSAIRAAIAQWYPEDDEFLDESSAGALFEEPVEEEVPAQPVVLMADADPKLVEELAERVREEDCEVIVVHDGKEARSICRERKPAVAFLDAALPKIDGYNILLELRSKNDDAAVFITSNRGDEFRQAKALELGADDFLVKPFAIELVTSKIRREVKKRASTGNRKTLGQTPTFAGVSGSLTEMTGLDILQSLELGRKTAHVVLNYEDGRNGELNIGLGNVKGAKSGRALGEEAFYSLMAPGPGLFRIEYRSSPTPENISKPNTYLMIEAMRRLDEDGREAEEPKLQVEAKGSLMAIPSGNEAGTESAEPPPPPSPPDDRPDITVRLGSRLAPQGAPPPADASAEDGVFPDPLDEEASDDLPMSRSPVDVPGVVEAPSAPAEAEFDLLMEDPKTYVPIPPTPPTRFSTPAPTAPGAPPPPPASIGPVSGIQPVTGVQAPLSGYQPAITPPGPMHPAGHVPHPHPHGPVSGQAPIMQPHGPVSGHMQAMPPQSTPSGPMPVTQPHGPVSGHMPVMQPHGPVSGHMQAIPPQGPGHMQAIPPQGPGHMQAIPPQGPVSGHMQAIPPQGHIQAMPQGPGHMQAMPPQGPVSGHMQAMPPQGPVSGHMQAIPPQGPVSGHGPPMPQGPVSGHMPVMRTTGPVSGHIPPIPPQATPPAASPPSPPPGQMQAIPLQSPPPGPGPTEPPSGSPPPSLAPTPNAPPVPPPPSPSPADLFGSDAAPDFDPSAPLSADEFAAPRTFAPAHSGEPAKPEAQEAQGLVWHRKSETEGKAPTRKDGKPLPSYELPRVPTQPSIRRPQSSEIIPPVRRSPSDPRITTDED